MMLTFARPSSRSIVRSHCRSPVRFFIGKTPPSAPLRRRRGGYALAASVSRGLSLLLVAVLIGDERQFDLQVQPLHPATECGAGELRVVGGLMDRAVVGELGEAVGGFPELLEVAVPEICLEPVADGLGQHRVAET